MTNHACIAWPRVVWWGRERWRQVPLDSSSETRRCSRGRCDDGK
jgi:hypothetical protein